MAKARGELWSGRAALLVWGPIAAITALHYAADPHQHLIHDVARRLFVLPVFLGAWLGGLRGGVLTAAVVIAVYIPHGWLAPAHSMDPADDVQKLLEVALYLAVGAVGGVLIDRERRERARQSDLAAELQRTLDEVRAMEAQLVRAGRLGALGELTAGLAHEIRNPLHAMRGTAEILLDAVPAGAPERPLAEAHLREIDRLNSLLGRFLAFARQTETRAEPVDLDEITARVAALISAAARQDGVALEVADHGPLMVRADADQLVQVVLGIAINGLQAIRESGQGGRVSLSPVAREVAGRAWCGVRVENDGPPVPEEIREQIFDPFFSTREGGTGLGLATAWRIADAHGGLLEVENLPGGAGVAFTLLLPAPVDPG